MADSPSRIRTPWLRDDCACAAEDKPDVEMQRLGGETSGRGVLRRLLCRGVVALGVVAAVCLVTRHQVSKAMDGPEYELIFEGEVPPGKDNFTLHVGSLCFGASPFVGSASKAPPVGGIRLEVQADQDWRTIYGRGRLMPDVLESERVWKVVNALNVSDPQGLEFYEFRGRSADGVDRPQRAGHIALWEETVRGAVTYDGKWLLVSGRGFLPMFMEGVPVLQQQMEAFFVDNERFRARGAGLFFRRSQNHEDRDFSNFALWGEVVHGYVTPSGRFLVVPGRGYLPMEVYGFPVLRRIQVAAATLDGDWLTRNGTLVRIEGDIVTRSHRSGRRPEEAWTMTLEDVEKNRARHDNWTWTLEHEGNGTYYATFDGATLSAEHVRDSLVWSNEDVWVKVAGASADTAPDAKPGWEQGEMAWLVFDDQEVHWGRAAKAFNTSTVYEKYKVANTVSRFLPPPWPDHTSVTSAVQIREGFARHWHITLVGSGVETGGRPRTRYRVWARSQLSSGAPGEFHPKKCPGQPMVWMQRKVRQMYEYVQI